MGDTPQDRLRFWRDLLILARKRGVYLHSDVPSNETPYLSARAGSNAGTWFGYRVLLGRASVELYISTGDRERSIEIFRSLRRFDNEIERAFGHSLMWQELPGNACRVRFELPQGGLTDKHRWPQIQESMIMKMAALAKAIGPYLT